MKRRDFFKLFAGTVVATAIPTKIIEQVLTSNVSAQTEDALICYNYNTGKNITFHEIVTNTFRKNSHKLLENITQNNALLARLNKGPIDKGYKS